VGELMNECVSRVRGGGLVGDWVQLAWSEKNWLQSGCSDARLQPCSDEHPGTLLTNLQAPITSRRTCRAEDERHIRLWLKGLAFHSHARQEIGFIIIYSCSLRRGSCDLTRRRTLLASVTDLATYPCSLHQPSRRSVADPSQIPSPVPAIHPMHTMLWFKAFFFPLSLKSLVFLNELIIFLFPLPLVNMHISELKENERRTMEILYALVV
jgi:hypothetical protein